jgi:hypothetical protein
MRPIAGQAARQKVLGEVGACVYGQLEDTAVLIEIDNMSERQKRTDIGTANVVTRAINILAVRNRSLAQHYMECNDVPAGVVQRVLDQPGSRRAPSAEQVISEAITPSPPGQRDD